MKEEKAGKRERRIKNERGESGREYKEQERERQRDGQRERKIDTIHGAQQQRSSRSFYSAPVCLFLNITEECII